MITSKGNVLDIFADLHNHTTASDGDYSPEGLVEKARELGLKALGITDHDTLNGLGPALEAGHGHDLVVVPGVEVSVRFKLSMFTGTLHLLCYFRPEKLKDDAFVRAFGDVLSKGRGQGLVRARIDQINMVFGPHGSSPLLKRDMNFEDISVYSSNASRRHFAMALDQRLGIRDKEVINAIIGNDSPAYLPSGIDLGAAAGFIKEHRITPVLAHPAAGSYPGQGHYREVLPPVETVEKLLPDFLDAGIQGIEVNYPGHSPEHRALVLSWAKNHDLFITGGSDCHDGIERPLGVAGISEQEFKRFKGAL